MELSWLQQYALMVLVRHETARVKDLTPRDIPANAFAYHLQGLVAQKLITKIDRGRYQLTAKGQKLAARVSTQTNKVSEELRTVIMLYAQKADKFLLFRWSRQPYMGEVTLVYDHVSSGQRLSEALKNALEDKLGDAEIGAEYLKSAFVYVMSNGEIVSHMHAMIYRIDASSIPDSLVSRNGEAFWSRLDEADVMDGVRETMSMMDHDEMPFEVEWHYDVI